MEKLKLEMESLRVESYATRPAECARGTIGGLAAASGHPDCTNVYLCTLRTGDPPPYPTVPT